jgi:GNAT superfamily N-acetyltransferase
MHREPNVTIEPLGSHPDLIGVTVAWQMNEWDPDGDTSRWTRARIAEARMTGIPCAWVAFADAAPVGSVSLVENNMDTRKDLSPWLAALYVIPSYRRRGIGTALVRRCEQEAWSTGVKRLYLHTTTARDLYERLGWATLGEEAYEGGRVTVMLRTSAELIG